MSGTTSRAVVHQLWLGGKMGHGPGTGSPQVFETEAKCVGGHCGKVFGGQVVEAADKWFGGHIALTAPWCCGPGQLCEIAFVWFVGHFSE